jgi:hypothetical protein
MPQVTATLNCIGGVFMRAMKSKNGCAGSFKILRRKQWHCGRRLPRIAEDPTRVPDHIFSGPDLPFDEQVRARFFGEC